MHPLGGRGHDNTLYKTMDGQFWLSRGTTRISECNACANNFLNLNIN
jgi:hypothetical protein